MDCCICGPMASVFRPPRNTICLSCYEAARNMNSFLDGLEIEEGGVAPDPGHPLKSLADIFRWMEKRRKVEEEVNERLRFMETSLVAFEDGMHTDILMEPGEGPSIPAHKALLATKSEILRTLLSSDECKAPAADTISLPELTHQQLHSLLHFLYSGKLIPLNDVNDNDLYALLLAADKYDVPYLRAICEKRILASLGPSNALDVLQVSEACSDAFAMREKAMASIANHVKEIVFSSCYEAFAAKNVHLCVEITRMLARNLLKDGKGGDSGGYNERNSCRRLCREFEVLNVVKHAKKLMQREQVGEENTRSPAK